MNINQKDFLSLGPSAWPARLTVQQTAWILGLEPHQFAPLVKAGLLSPLGKPESTAPKFYALGVVLRLRDDTRWLERASVALTAHWQKKNAARPKPPFRDLFSENHEAKDIQ